MTWAVLLLGWALAGVCCGAWCEKRRQLRECAEMLARVVELNRQLMSASGDLMVAYETLKTTASENVADLGMELEMRRVVSVPPRPGEKPS